MEQQNRKTETLPNGKYAFVRNQRLTALAGAVLFLLILIELFITANIHALVSAHIFVGVMLSGPLFVKMGSTGYRFVRYYTKSAEFVRHGRPHLLLRLLAPFVVIFTVLVIASGFIMTVVGPTHARLYFKIHTFSVAVWLPLIAIHIYAHIRNASRVIKADWSGSPDGQVKGRAHRYSINIVALIMGAVAALLMIPASAPWANQHIPPGIPSKLAIGLAAAIFALLIAVSLRSLNKKSTSAPSNAVENDLK